MATLDNTEALTLFLFLKGRKIVIKSIFLGGWALRGGGEGVEKI